jgi:hypothetical protein
VTLGIPAAHKSNDVSTADGFLPLIASPVTTATRRINTALRNANVAWRTFKKECLGTARRQDMEMERSAEVTMNSGRYLSIVVNEEWNCPGTAHPDHDSIAMVYDLQTGRPLNWLAVLPHRLVSNSHVSASVGGLRVGLLASPDLDKLYVQAERQSIGSKDAEWWAECSDPLSDEAMEFIAWPDAKRDGIALLPVGLGHAVANCANDALISTATLRSLGANAAFVDEIEAAHRGVVGRR